jgi:bacteriophage HK97-gp10 putative tail-component
MGCKLSGVAEMKARLAAVKATVHAQIVSAVEAEANRLLDLAKARTPVEVTKHAKEPGELRDSGTVTVAESGSKVTAVISFGTDYAVYQHEDLSLRHENGQAKFLESVLNEEVGNAADNLAKGIDLGKIVP